MLVSTNKARKASATLFALLFVMGLIVGGLGIYYLSTRQTANLTDQITDLQNRVSLLSNAQNQTIANQTIIIYQNNTSLTDIYTEVSQSVVLVHGSNDLGTVQASGFVYNHTGTLVVLTNYHVVEDMTSLSVTFSNGNGYLATVLGTDPYADLAVLLVDAPVDELKPLTIVSSSSLQVGDQVIAIGNPYGLVGSLTTGVVSALGRSETADFTSQFSIANMIQTSTPINPGSSGGPLLNSLGNVVGITNSRITNSQGLVFAVPSNTILKEIGSLIATGGYSGHSYLGIHVVDMTYELAQQQNFNITYGVWIPSGTGQTLIEPDGPSDGKLADGDLIIALNGTKIQSNDNLASYLEEKTLPNDNLVVTFVRDNATKQVTLTLGTRPAATL